MNSVELKVETEESPHAGFAHRKHLDSIRGLACLAVILFHCDIPSFSNGYLGVSVFFVLSGFLISSKLFCEFLDETRNFNLLLFYCRRFRRLFPASAFVLISTALLYRYLELPEYVQKHRMSFIASSLYFENFHNIKIELDYFKSQWSDKSPVLHFWSLSCEEQFYAVYPFIVWTMFFVCQKKLKVILGFLIITFIASIGLSFHIYQSAPMASFYSIAGRFYQLTAGAILAILVMLDPDKKKVPGQFSVFWQKSAVF